MELQKKFDKWLEDEKFVTFANKRLKDEILHVPENHLLDPKHEELEEGFENYDCYAAPLATYLTYCLQLAKCSRNAKKRKRGIGGCMYKSIYWDSTPKYSLVSLKIWSGWLMKRLCSYSTVNIPKV